MSAPATGSLDDRVRLRLGGDEIMIAESWDVLEGALATPACFSLELGSSQPFVDLFLRTVVAAYPEGPKYPKGTRFELFVGDDQQMTGRIEGFKVGGAATRISIKGRDDLAALARAHSEAIRSFLNGTYEDLVTWALVNAGLPDYQLTASNAANRQIKAGVPINQISQSLTIDQINDPAVVAALGIGQADTGVTVGAVTSQQHQNRIDESLLSFIRRHLDRAGLFLWAGATENTFILSQPNGAQEPTYRLVRKRGVRESSNIIDCEYIDDATNRHGVCTVYGRGGGRVGGRAKAKGSSFDSEIINLGNLTGSGWAEQPVLYRDVNVQNTEQAEFFASRKIAEECRNGWSLTYRVSGHRLPSPDGTQFPVLTYDTTIRVEDDELGLGPSDPQGGIYYIESVRRMRNPSTMTEIRLMRVSDLIFGTGGVA